MLNKKSFKEKKEKFITSRVKEYSCYYKPFLEEKLLIVEHAGKWFALYGNIDKSSNIYYKALVEEVKSMSSLEEFLFLRKLSFQSDVVEFNFTTYKKFEKNLEKEEIQRRSLIDELRRR